MQRSGSALAITSGTFTFDLNGHTLRCDDYTTLWIDDNAVITIVDSATGGSIESGSTSGDAVHNRGTLTIESGTFKGALNAVSNRGSLTVTGGTLEGQEYAVYMNSGSTTQLNGGTFTGIVWGFASYTITGGSYTADYIGINKDGCVLTVTGGTFDIGQFNIWAGEISVTGGDFSINPTTYVPVGYAVTYANSYYTVSLCTAHSWENGFCTLCGTVCAHEVYAYSASGSTVTAICTNCDYGGSITVSAAGKTYDGTPVVAALTGTIAGVEMPEIVYSGNTDAGTYTASISLGGVTASVTFTITPAEITAEMITVSTTVYNGQVQTPNGSHVTVTVNGVVLEHNVDYYISVYPDHNFTDAGTYPITVVGQGNYTGSVELTFTIKKADPTYTVPEGITAAYGDLLRDVVLPTGWQWADAETTVLDSLGTYTYSANFIPEDADNYNTVYNVQITVTVEPRDASDAKVELEYESVVFDGTEKRPQVTAVTFGTFELLKDRDYVVSYANNTEIGTATVTVTFQGNFTGSVEVTFQIIAHTHDWAFTASGDTIIATCGNAATCPVEGHTVTIQLIAPADLAFDGNAKTVTVTQTPAGFFTDLPAIVYSGDCVSTGTHTASLTYSGVTATLSFTVTCEHSFVAGEYVWNETNTACSVIGTCQKGCGATATANATVSAQQTLDPTCGAKGETTYTATFAEDWATTQVKVVDDIPATGNHIYVAGEYVWNADYTACSVVGTCTCSATATANAAVTSLQTKAPECAVNGETTYTATFTENWATTQTKTVADVPATGHSYESVVTEPTCTEEGFTTYTCHCGDSYVADYVPLLGHDLTQHAAQAPTCTDIGWEAYETCSRCDHNTYVELPAAGHNYFSVLTEQTCTEDGFITYTCEECGDSYIRPYLKAMGHKEVIDAGVEATCTETGLTEGSHCEVCGEVLVAQTVIPVIDHVDEDKDFFCDECGEDLCTEHVEQILPEILPTCTEDGLTQGSRCAICGEVLVEQEIVPALGHDYEAVVTEPTCTEEGYTTYTCACCGDSYTEQIPVAEHNFVGGVCTECGETTEIVLGDVNGDGKVDSTDAKLIMQYDLGLIDETGLDLSMADTNGDGLIDTTDAKLIMQFDLGIITEFPVP